MEHTNDYGPEYSPQEWLNLVSEVDRQGGAVLPERCEGQPLEFKARPGVSTAKGSKTETCHCGNESMAVVIYTPHFPAKQMQAVKDRGGGFARVCLVCDAAGAWPQFSEVMDRPEDDA